jgi:tryptophanyl-tRNA synthetase
MRILSGVQPSGRLHIGNYFGAIRQHLKFQDDGKDCFYFIANYHAMTSGIDKAQMEKNTLHVATAYMALGLDPAKSTFFVQSDVPEVTELCWVLNCVCPMSLMEKATSYKDKIAKGLTSNVGLFDYPVLQAADIMIYDSNLVPVGADQKQHVEITRDLAVKFNAALGQELLVVPEEYIVPAVAIVPGIDGQKMSKSYDNAIEMFATDKQTQKRCAQIVTDSTPLEAPKDPDKCNVFTLIKLFATPEEQQEIAGKYRAGGYGYGHAKKRLAELINERFAAARERYAKLEADPSYVRDVMCEGGKKARKVAAATMQRIRAACGLMTSY